MKKFLMIAFFVSFGLNAVELNLKINKTENSVALLNVNIPSNFVVGSKSPDKTELLIQYIPKGEKIRRWSEIITVSRNVVSNKDIQTLLKGIQEQYRSEKADCKISMQEEKGVPVAFLTVDKEAVIPSAFCGGGYEKIPGQNEITMMKIVQGEKSISVVQYSARYEENISSSKKKEIVNKISGFLNSCLIQQTDSTNLSY